MSEHYHLGISGENKAVEYLLGKGYTILERNWRFGKAEIDIIARKEPGTIVIVEVKTRNNAWAGDPQEFVTEKKIKLLVQAADAYLQENELDDEVRFDIIALIINNQYEKLEHIEDAFYFF